MASPNSSRWTISLPPAPGPGVFTWTPCSSSPFPLHNLVVLPAVWPCSSPAVMGSLLAICRIEVRVLVAGGAPGPHLLLLSCAGMFPGKGGMVAPGMTCQYTVQFFPDCLGDFDDFILVETQSAHTLLIPLQARRPPPVLTRECVLCLPWTGSPG